MNQGMKKHVKIAAACFAVSGLVMTNAGVSALAAGTGLAGLDSMKIDVKTEAVETSSEETAAAEQTATVEETAVVEETEAAAPQENLVNTYAVAQLDDESYINIRSSADTESEVVGKLYNSNVATILADDGEWLYVRSGNCEGYVAKYLMTTGSDAAAVVDSVATDVVSVNVEGLMLRADSSEDSDVIGMVSAGDAVYLNEDLGGWAKVTTSDGTVGYVSADYVTYEKELPQAESREEEAARVAAEEAQYAAWLAEQERLYLEEVARQQAEWEAQNQAWIEYLQSTGQAADAQTTVTETPAVTTDVTTDVVTETPAVTADVTTDVVAETPAVTTDVTTDVVAETPAVTTDVTTDVVVETPAATTDVTSDVVADTGDSGTSSTRQQVVDYALQFVGNPYVYGGTSLTNGTDCSGFTQSVLSEFGIDVNRTAGQQSQGGSSVDMDSLQPGDLLFYSGSGDYGIGHVSMYIGNDQVVHASNSTDGIIVSDVNYRTPVSAKSYID